MMRIGILHPGEMGAYLASNLRASGHELYWVPAGRGEASRRRAAELGLRESSGLEALCRNCEMLLAVCPPHAAGELAGAVREAGFRGLYADVNAIAPATMRQIGLGLQKAGIDCVDGGIIGVPSAAPGATTLYLSGPRANEVAACFSAGPLGTEVLDGGIGKASALKMCYAANSKGTVALLSAILGAAESLGVREALETQWERDKPGVVDAQQQRIRGVARKAWRFTGEMREIAATLEAAGLPGDFHRGAATIYERQSAFKDSGEAPSLEAILAALLNRRD